MCDLIENMQAYGEQMYVYGGDATGMLHASCFGILKVRDDN